jgi:zinc transport system substrate-binding protein
VGIVVAVGLATALRAPAGATAHTPRARLDVVAASYPVAYAAERVGGRRVDVTNLTPPGVEPHDLELTPPDRDAIDDAGVVLVMGDGFQPAIEKAAATRGHAAVELLDELPARSRVADDPHVWLDPTLMAVIVDEVARAYTRADPRGKAAYNANATAVHDELAALDERYRSGLADCDRHLIVTTHDAFGYLARRYGLEQQAVSGVAPDAEPDPRRLGQLADLAARKGVTTVFTETLVSRKVAETLAREAGGLKTAVLDPIEGLTTKEQRAGDDYLSVMDRNLIRLRDALGCH